MYTYVILMSMITQKDLNLLINKKRLALSILMADIYREKHRNTMKMIIDTKNDKKNFSIKETKNSQRYSIY